MTKTPIIEVNNLTYIYPRQPGGRRPAPFHDLNLTVYAGERILLTGDSGSGKSTFLRCLNGLIPHSESGKMEGTVNIAGIDTRNSGISQLASHVGMVFQDPDYQLFCADVESEIAYGLEQHGVSPQEMQRRIEEVIELLRITHLRGRMMDTLSWGERQRVAIASVLVMRPEILLLDEPLSGLDEGAVKTLIEVLKNLNELLGLTIIIAEHRTNCLEDFPTRYIHFGDPASGNPAVVRCPAVSCTSDNSLSLSQVNFAYGESDRLVLSDLTLSFHSGMISVLMGENGSGKSTLIRHANGILRPDSGEVFVHGENIRDKTVAEISSSVGICFQHADYQLFEETILDELLCTPRIRGYPVGPSRCRARSILDDLGLLSLGEKSSPLKASVGEKQRIAISTLLMMDSSILILDEPTLGLDASSKQILVSILHKERDLGKTVIVATHDRGFADLCADRIITLSGGRVINDTGVLR